MCNLLIPFSFVVAFGGTDNIHHIIFIIAAHYRGIHPRILPFIHILNN